MLTVTRRRYVNCNEKKIMLTVTREDMLTVTNEF